MPQDQRLEVALERSDLDGELADARQQLAADTQQHARRLLSQLALESLQDLEVVQRTAGRVDRRVELVEQPAQTALQPRALDDQVRAMIEQQRDLALDAGQLRDRQVGLAQRRPSDRERVDRVALAERALPSCRAPAISFGGTRTTRSPAPQQRLLQMPRQIAAVLDRPLALLLEPLGELQQPAMPRLIRGDRQLGRAGGRCRRRRPRPCASACARRSR